MSQMDELGPFLIAIVSIYWALLSTIGVIMQLAYFFRYRRAYIHTKTIGVQEREASQSNYESQACLCGVHTLLFMVALLSLPSSLHFVDGGPQLILLSLLTRLAFIAMVTWLVITLVRNWVRLQRMLVRLEKG